MWSIKVTKDDPKHRGGPGGSIEGSKRFYFCFTRTVLPGPTHLKSPPGIPKTIVIYIIYKYRGLGLGLGLGLGGVQKAKTRQIDASEIIGKAGSSEQEGPNHPKSPSKT